MPGRRRCPTAVGRGVVLAGLVAMLPAAADAAAGRGTGGAPDAETVSRPSVISINLCADQLVLELADEGQVLALSALARDRRGSRHHARAAAYPSVSGRSAEELVALGPDLVIVGPYTSRHTLALLAQLGLRVESLPIAESIEVAMANVARVGEWLAQRDRARERVADMRARLHVLGRALERDGDARPGAIVYDASGYTVGADTLRGEALTLAGWRNLASEAGVSGYAPIALESLVVREPDALVESPFDPGSRSRAQALAAHPALRAGGLDPLVVTLPSAWTICAGPWSIDVVERLHAARETLGRRDGRSERRPRP